MMLLLRSCSVVNLMGTGSPVDDWGFFLFELASREAQSPNYGLPLTTLKGFIMYILIRFSCFHFIYPHPIRPCSGLALI